MGDFNFHMENIDSYSVKNMIDLLDEFGLKQHVTDRDPNMQIMCLI